MRVLHIDHSGLPGGGQLGLLRYAKLRQAADHSYRFIEGGPVLDDLRSLGIDAARSALPSAGLKDLVARRRMFRAELNAANCDLIVANSFRAAVAVALADPSPPCFYYVRQDMTSASMGWLNGSVAKAAVFPRFEGYIANSQWTLETVPTRLLRSVPHGIAYPLSGMTVGVKREVAQNDERALNVAWVGRLAHWKGLHVVLDAMGELERAGVRVNLSVAGASIHEDPNYAHELRLAAARLAHPPRFLGHIDDVSGMLARHDVLVHSSIRPEPFGQVLVQGMAAGLAVVATQGGGPGEIIQHERDGILVPPANATALASVLTQLAANPARVASLGAAARESARRRFTDSVLATAFDEIVKEMHSELT